MGRPKKIREASDAVEESVLSGVESDALVDVISSTLNKEIMPDSSENIAFLLDGGSENPADIIDWISTGNDILDFRISNRMNGGIPVGRISEITGLEGSGKSLLAAHLLVSTQKKGGVGVFIDTEAAISREFLAAIGVDMKKLVYVSLECIEDIFATIESIVNTVRKSDKDRLVTIVVDSVSGATTKIEQDADYEKDGWATSKAIILSKAMRKITNMIAKQRIALIFTNQLRTKLGVMFGDPWTTSGGKALAFHCSVRLRLKAMGQLKVGDEVVGIKTECKVVKNRVGPPLRKAAFNIYFGSGIDNYESWINELKDGKVISGTAAGYSFNVDVPEKWNDEKFKASNFPEMLQDPELKKILYDEIAKKLLFVYNKPEEVTLDINDKEGLEE